jgi:hypothetical protein
VDIFDKIKRSVVALGQYQEQVTGILFPKLRVKLVPDEIHGQGSLNWVSQLFSGSQTILKFEKLTTKPAAQFGRHTRWAHG